MRENAKQYIKRIRGYVAGQNHFAIMQTTPKKLALLIRKFPPKKLNLRPTPNQWSAAEILAHLAESEIVISYRFRLVLAANGAQLQAVDQDSWQINARYLIDDAKRALELFSVLRANNIALLKSLSRRQWSRYGIHTERGKESVARIVEMYAGHDVNHVRQIRNILRVVRP